MEQTTINKSINLSEHFSLGEVALAEATGYLFCMMIFTTASMSDWGALSFTSLTISATFIFLSRLASLLWKISKVVVPLTA